MTRCPPASSASHTNGRASCWTISCSEGPRFVSAYFGAWECLFGANHILDCFYLCAHTTEQHYISVWNHVHVDMHSLFKRLKAELASYTGECYSDAIYGMEGYWRGSLSQETFYKCKEDVCLAETDQSSTPCVEGHKGMLCAACVDG